jgi:replicative DNA helicase
LSAVVLRDASAPPVKASASGRIPVSDNDAETCVLSACMLDPGAYALCLPILGEGRWFYSPAHRRIWQAVGALVGEGAPVDAQTVASRLLALNRLAECGGGAYLAGIVDAVPHVANVEAYARTVAELGRQRDLVALCQRVAAEGYERHERPDEWVDEKLRELGEAAEGRASTGTSRIGELAVEAYEEVKNPTSRGSVSTGLHDLDRKIGGLHRGTAIVVGGRPGMGKAQPLDAKLLTPYGWSTMGEAKVGMRVIGADGRATRVVAVHERGALDVYRVVFDDGAAVECCGDHLWLTKTKRDRASRRPGKVRSTDEIRKTLRAGKHANHSVPFAAPCVFDDPGDLPVDAYLLGVYLGDGDSTGNVRISKPERDVLGRAAAGLPPQDEASFSSDRMVVRRAKRNRQPSETKKALARLGLAGLGSHERFIPQAYLLASEPDRWALLRGLCDTDGFVTKAHKSIEYSTSSPALRDGFAFLVGSLGGRVTWSRKTPTYRYRGELRIGRTSFRMIVSFPTGGRVPVSSDKHVPKWDADAGRVAERYVVSVEPVGQKACRCITVDREDGLYVTDEFVVTHNSGLVLGFGLHVAAHGGRVALFSAESPKRQIVHRAKSALSGIAVDAWQKRTVRLEQLTEATQLLQSYDLHVYDDKRTIDAVRAEVSRLHREAPLDLVVADYLQKFRVGAGSRAGNREQEVSEMSAFFSALALDFDVPVVVVSQLNRNVEEREPPVPLLGDLRESGALENDAYMVFFPYRDLYYEQPQPADTSGPCDLIVAKNKDGPVGTVRVYFHAMTTSFRGLEPHEREP